MDTFNFFDAWNECNKIEIVFLDLMTTETNILDFSTFSALLNYNLFFFSPVTHH